MHINLSSAYYTLGRDPEEGNLTLKCSFAGHLSEMIETTLPEASFLENSLPVNTMQGDSH